MGQQCPIYGKGCPTDGKGCFSRKGKEAVKLGTSARTRLSSDDSTCRGRTWRRDFRTGCLLRYGMVGGDGFAARMSLTWRSGGSARRKLGRNPLLRSNSAVQVTHFRHGCCSRDVASHCLISYGRCLSHGTNFFMGLQEIGWVISGDHSGR
jgi:hypothetical protein